jgi:RsiW-degrading membrane proteinase PrsW (M82 family)
MFTCATCGRRSLNPLGSYLPPVHEQVRRDRRHTSTALVVLGAIGATGAAVLGTANPAFMLVAILGILGMVFAGTDRGKHPLFKVLMGVFAIGGVLVLLAFAVLLYLFVACSMGAFKWGG